MEVAELLTYYVVQGKLFPENFYRVRTFEETILI